VADPSASLQPGQHTVRIEARLPGTDVVFSSNEVSVGLFCRERVTGETPSGIPWAALPPSSRPGQEAPAAVATPESASTAGESPAQPLAATSAGGCALLPSSSTRPAPAAALLALALIALRRRGARSPS
jgi:hypothetical protein